MQAVRSESKEKRLKDCEDYDKAYWAAYLDGARAQKREDNQAVLVDMPTMGGFHDD